jgi:hypothetical protein
VCVFSFQAQQEVQNLREELAQHSVQHEEELRALEEDFEMEKERLLLLQEELSEQLVLKDRWGLVLHIGDGRAKSYNVQ